MLAPLTLFRPLLPRFQYVTALQPAEKFGSAMVLGGITISQPAEKFGSAMVLGGAAVYRCDNPPVLTSASATEVQLPSIKHFPRCLLPGRVKCIHVFGGVRPSPNQTRDSISLRITSFFLSMNCCRRGLKPLIFSLSLCGFLLFHPTSARAAQTKTKWIRVSSDHFSVLTDADRDKGREVAVRLEEMRSVFGQLLLKRKLNMSEPLDVIAFRSDKEYAEVAPIRDGQPTSAPGFFLSGPDRNYIVLNLFESNSWLAVTHEFSHYFLNYNYPPTQPWFDEGFAEYFSSLHLSTKQAQIGGDPEMQVTWDEDIVGHQTLRRNPPRSLTELLTAPVWLATPDLFTMHEYKEGYKEGTHHTLFYAQSWMIVHYLLNKEKLSETGSYFDLVESQNVPVPQAIQQAYGMSVAQFDQAVKDYFKTLTPLFLALDASKQPDTKTFNLSAPAYQVAHLPLTVDAENVGTSIADIPEAEAQATVAEMALRMPEHRQQATTQLQAIEEDPKLENAISHRALGWVHMQKKEFDLANAELGQALGIDPKDPWVHYYQALMRYQQAQSGDGAIPGLANVMQDLRIVIDWDPDFAEAYNMLAVARIQGGGMHSAMDAILPALKLDPRNSLYRLNLAHVEMAQKKWDDAVAVLNLLKTDANPSVARSARKDLENLPTLKKYGLLPQAAGQPTAAAIAGPKTETASAKQDSGNGDEDAGSSPSPPPSLLPDKRPVKFLKGTLISVDCTHAPSAVLSISATGRNWKLRTDNYKSLSVIGANEFTCSWTHIPITVNYKAGGQADGDLVSLELR